MKFNHSFSVLMVALVVSASGASAQTMRSDGGGHIGGGDFVGSDLARVKLLLEGGALKEAMLAYVRSLPLAKVSDPAAKAALTRMLAGGALQRDISTADNYVASESCAGAEGESKLASTAIGQVGARICYDIAAIARQLNGYSAEDGTIRLASLAMHEHTHHFQKVALTKTDSIANEREANAVDAYIQLTAKFLLVPTLTWSAPRTGPAEDHVRCVALSQISSGDLPFKHVKGDPTDGEFYTFQSITHDGVKFKFMSGHGQDRLEAYVNGRLVGATFNSREEDLTLHVLNARGQAVEAFCSFEE